MPYRRQFSGLRSEPSGSDCDFGLHHTVNYFKGLRFLYNLTSDPFLPQDVLGYGYNIKWTYFAKNGVNEFNTLARESVRDGFPAILGIGHLIHYVVAYSYLEHRYEIAPGVDPYWRA